MNARAVGIDPSLSATGVAMASGQLCTIRSEPDDGSIGARHQRIANLAQAIADRVGHDVNLVVIEGPSYAQRTQAGEHLRAGLWWKIIAHLDGLHDIVEASPSTLKKFATGKGNATKADMRMALYQRAGIDLRDDNQVDAWWLRQLGLHLLDADDAIDLPRVNLSALEKVRRP